jgi:hypothetical protein
MSSHMHTYSLDTILDKYWSNMFAPLKEINFVDHIEERDYNHCIMKLINLESAVNRIGFQLYSVTASKVSFSNSEGYKLHLDKHTKLFTCKVEHHYDDPADSYGEECILKDGTLLELFAIFNPDLTIKPSR